MTFEPGGGGVALLCRPQDRVRPALFKEKVGAVLGTGGTGMSLNGLS